MRKWTSSSLGWEHWWIIPFMSRYKLSNSGIWGAKQKKKTLNIHVNTSNNTSFDNKHALFCSHNELWEHLVKRSTHLCQSQFIGVGASVLFCYVFWCCCFCVARVCPEYKLNFYCLNTHPKNVLRNETLSHVQLMKQLLQQCNIIFTGTRSLNLIPASKQLVFVKCL